MKVLDYGAERKWQGLSALSVPLLPKPLYSELHWGQGGSVLTAFSLQQGDENRRLYRVSRSPAEPPQSPLVFGAPTAGPEKSRVPFSLKRTVPNRPPASLPFTT